MDDSRFAALKLENQLCFPLYACSREIIKRYTPFLNELELTYTQYITLMVLWEKETITMKELGCRLYLDSGTLTPLLKTLEAKGLISRRRSGEDERVLVATLTDAGRQLKERAVSVPEKMTQCAKLEAEEAAALYRILYKVLNGLEKEGE